MMALAESLSRERDDLSSLIVVGKSLGASKVIPAGTWNSPLNRSRTPWNDLE